MEIIAIIQFESYFLNEITLNENDFKVNKRGGLKLERPSFLFTKILFMTVIDPYK